MDKQALLDGEGRAREESIVVYSSRWWTLAMFCSLSLTTATMWVTFAPISDDTSIYFDGIGNTAVNMLAVIFQILYPPGTYLCVLCMKKYGLRANLLIGAALTFLGSVVRVCAMSYRYELGATGAYALVFFGQSLGALAQPMFVNVPAAIAAKWFPVKEREIATTVASLFNPLGNAFGQVLPPMFVKETADDDGVTGMRDLMVCEAIIIFVPLLVAFFFFKSEPPSPPSHSTRLRTTVGNDDAGGKSSNNRVADEFWELMKNKDYLILLLSFSVGLGLFNSILTLIYQIISPYGYSNDDAGTFGAVLIVCGLVGAAFTGFLLEKTKKYRTILKGGFIIVVFMACFFFSMLYSNNFNGLIVAFAVLGFFMLPMLPAVLENCAEITYPISEEFSSGLLFMGGNILGIGMVFLVQATISMDNFGPPPFTPSNFVMFAILLFAAVVLAFYHGEYKRMHLEKKAPHIHGLLPTVDFTVGGDGADEEEER